MPTTIADINRYSTDQERGFIDGLGTYSTKQFGRLALLRGYQTGIAKRTDWGAINRVEIQKHVVASIEREAMLAGTR